MKNEETINLLEINSDQASYLYESGRIFFEHLLLSGITEIKVNKKLAEKLRRAFYVTEFPGGKGIPSTITQGMMINQQGEYSEKGKRGSVLDMAKNLI